MDDVLTLVLGGGRGARLYPLTQRRSEPAVPIAGKYRLIDIPISNCLNSGLKRIYVLTQFSSVSLHRHITNTYKFDPFGRGFVELLAAQQTNEGSDWYQGTADALRQNLPYVRDNAPPAVLVLSGDQLFRMDFRQLWRTHHASRADVTLAVLPVDRERVTGLGVVRADNTGRITDFVEKPAAERQLQALRTPAEWLRQRGLVVGSREYLGNMAIYLFNTAALYDLLGADPSATCLVTEVFPRNLSRYRFQAHLFDGYWEDVGTVRRYHAAGLALASDDPPFDFHSPDGVIFSRMRNLPASRLSAVEMEQCLVSDGCLVESGTRMRRSLLGLRSRVGRDVTLSETLVLGADRYETDHDRAGNRQRGVPDIGVGDGSVVERAILDRDCRIGRGVRIVNRAGVREADGPNYAIRDGIVVVPDGAVVPDGTVI
jgi:glucose-1-phosphate adenylyltransferase